MASPQVENGYTRIANELFDAILCADLGKRQAKVLWAVIRLTYGFNKKSDVISIFQIAKMTGIDKSHAGRAVKELAGRSILTLEQSGRYEHGQELYRIGVNKDHSQWETVANIATVANSAPVPNQQQNGCQNGNGTVAKTATETVAKLAPTKDIKTGKTEKTGGARAKQVPKPEGVSDEVWKDALDHRKRMKAPLTETAWKRMEPELRALEAEGWSPDDVIAEWLAAGWRAFKADWIRNRGGSGKSEETNNPFAGAL